MPIEQWGFFSVPHVLWHEAYVYNGHLRKHVTLHLLSKVWQWGCLYLFLQLGYVAAGIRKANLPLAGQHSNALRKRRGQFRWKWPICSWEDFLNFVIVFSLLRNYLPLETGGACHLNKLEFTSLNYAFCNCQVENKPVVLEKPNAAASFAENDPFVLEKIF